MGIPQDLGGIDHFKGAQAGHEHGIAAGDGFQGGRPGIDDLHGFPGISLFAGDGPHQGIMVGRIGIGIVGPLPHRRVAAHHFHGALHFVSMPGDRVLAEELKTGKYRLLLPGYSFLHPLQVLAAVEQAGVHERLGAGPGHEARYSQQDQGC
jgi:hypothetical protein